MRSYRQEFRVHSFEVDPFDHLTVTALGGYLQEAANNNVRALGFGLDALEAQGKTWVLGRQEIDLLEPIRLHDSLEVETWGSGTERLALLRDYEVRHSDGRLLARGLSQWLILDLERRRPVRPETTIAPELLVEQRHVLPPGRERPPRLEKWETEQRLAVRYHDIDMNLHANNTAYLTWLVEGVPPEVWRNQRLVACDIQYLAECHLGAVVLSRSLARGEEFIHSVVRETDDKELARGVTRWAPRSAP